MVVSSTVRILPIETAPGGDSHALNGGWVTVTPLGLDQTAEEAFTLIQQYVLSPPQAVQTTELP